MADFVTKVNKQFKVTPVVKLGVDPGQYDTTTPLRWSLAPDTAGVIEPNPDGSGSALATLTSAVADVAVKAVLDVNLSPGGFQDLEIIGTVTATEVDPVIGADGGSLQFEPV